MYKYKVGVDIYKDQMKAKTRRSEEQLRSSVGALPQALLVITA